MEAYPKKKLDVYLEHTYTMLATININNRYNFSIPYQPLHAVNVYFNSRPCHCTCKVFVQHLLSHHNTFYNNGIRDRETESGGTITNVGD